MNESFFREIVQNHTEYQFLSYRSIGGGCINNTCKIETDTSPLFIKWNNLSMLDMFNKETQGLQLLTNLSSLHVPKVIGHGTCEDRSYLLLEWIDSGIMDGQFWKRFGRGLAQMHRESSEKFGLDHDNFIGRLPQSNTEHSNWEDFFIHERLIPQIKLASDRQLISSDLSRQFDTLFKSLDRLIPTEVPAFIHGDLWSGNFGSTGNNEPTVFDPAVHFGHRETELAFTHLFGGFSSDFYRHYEEEYPLQQGFRDRIDLHNLYPLLVHVNLFGASYLSGIIQTLRRFA